MEVGQLVGESNFTELGALALQGAHHLLTGNDSTPHIVVAAASDNINSLFSWGSDESSGQSSSATSTQMANGTNSTTATTSTDSGLLNIANGNVDASILLSEPSLILALAIIIEMLLPLPKKCKLSALYSIFAGLGRKVNRSGDSQSQRAFAGFFLPFLILTCLIFILLTVDIISNFDSLITLVALVYILELKYPQDQVIKVDRALHEGFKDKAKELLSSIVLRDTTPLSEVGIIKAGAESAILRIFEGWFAVIVWYYIAGIEGALMMQTIAVMARAFNYKLQGNHQFGKTIFHVYQVLLTFPAVVLALTLCCSLHPLKALQAGWAAYKTYPAATSGFVLGAIGGSLNLSLGGPRYYQGYIMRLPRVGGEGTPQGNDILRAMRKIRMAGLILLIVTILFDLNVIA